MSQHIKALFPLPAGSRDVAQQQPLQPNTLTHIYTLHIHFHLHFYRHRSTYMHTYIHTLKYCTWNMQMKPSDANGDSHKASVDL